jgi:hypothetical protein
VLQKTNPGIIISVKTQHAGRRILTAVEDNAILMRRDGFLDGGEVDMIKKVRCFVIPSVVFGRKFLRCFAPFYVSQSVMHDAHGAVEAYRSILMSHLLYLSIVHCVNSGERDRQSVVTTELALGVTAEAGCTSRTRVSAAVTDAGAATVYDDRSAVYC